MKRAILLGASGLRRSGRDAGRRLSGRAAAAPRWPTTRRSHDGRLRASTLDRKEVETIVRDYLLANPECCSKCSRRSTPSRRKSRASRRSAIINGANDEIFDSAHDGVVGNPNGKVTIVEFFDYNCGLLQTRHRGHAGADRRRSRPALRAQGIPDPRTGFAEGQRRLDGLPQADAGEIRRVPQPAARRPWPRRRGQRHQDRRLARRRRGQAARGDEGPGDHRASSTRPTTSPTSWRSPARPPMWSATKWCSARRAATCSARSSPWPRRPAPTAAC